MFEERVGFLSCFSLLAFLFSLPLGAQQTDVEQSRRRLEQIKQERDSLQREQLRIQGRVTEAGAVLRNLERQRDATNRLVNAIESEIGGLTSELDHAAAELTLAEDNLADRRAVLQRRLADIYKRGPLYTFQVLLTAESFGDLLTRWKYLALTSQQDRALVDDVTRLTANVRRDRQKLLGQRQQLDASIAEHESELARFARLEEEKQSQLRQLQRTAGQNKTRLTALDRAQAQLNDLLATLEKNSRAAAASRAARPPSSTNTAAGSTLNTADIGKLDWPVDGDIVIKFGPESLAGGGVIDWQGIGIHAPLGTPVKAVEAGTVELVQPLSLYGLSVFVLHSNGYRTMYMQLRTAAVKVGQEITRGTIIGTVGGANSGYGPHLMFEIRGANQIALDPIAWLRRR